MRLTEPDSAELLGLQEQVLVTLVGYETELVRLQKSDFLPRYHRLTVDFHNRSESTFDRIFVTVHRNGSTLAAKNFYTVPLHLSELKPHTRCRYSILSFDSFNLPFSSVQVNITTPEEYAQRRLSPEYMKRAPQLTTFFGALPDATAA
jgi:hypothetical protein